MKPRINEYSWEGINFPSEKDNWKKFQKNNQIIVIKVLYPKKQKLYLAYVSKHNLNQEKQVILLMIPIRKGWHYLAVRKTISIIQRNNI